MTMSIRFEERKLFDLSQIKKKGQTWVVAHHLHDSCELHFDHQYMSWMLKSWVAAATLLIPQEWVQVQSWSYFGLYKEYHNQRICQRQQRQRQRLWIEQCQMLPTEYLGVSELMMVIYSWYLPTPLRNESLGGSRNIPLLH